MKKLLLLLIFTCFVSNAQTVSNITTRQVQSTIVVSYDLETKLPCKVSLYVSTNGGKTWQGPLTKVLGDIGDKIISGKHSIIWNVLDEFDELQGDDIKFQVRAKRDNIETVKIGTQEWTTKNLDVSRYRNGDIIPEVANIEKWSKLTTGAWCYYKNDPKNGEIYGKLYNWYAVNDPRGLAPEGFHIPSDIEWTILTDYLGGEKLAPVKMKEMGYVHWDNFNYVGNNISGFSALPGGKRFNTSLPGDDGFKSIGISFCFWSDTFNADSKCCSWIRSYNENYYEPQLRYHTEVKSGCSVRCIRD